MKQVVVYPSGFVGYDVGFPVVRTEATFSANQALVRFQNATTREKQVIFNHIVEGLFAQWRVRARDPRDVKFISDVCAAVANAFGTNSFYEWCHMQMSSPYFTSAHRQYLNETLAFIDGQQRSYSYATWGKMLSLTRATPEDAREPYNYQQVMLTWGMDNTSVMSVLERWLRRPGGLEDMLAFSHIVFGDVY